MGEGTQRSGVQLRGWTRVRKEKDEADLQHERARYPRRCHLRHQVQGRHRQGPKRFPQEGLEPLAGRFVQDRGRRQAHHQGRGVARNEQEARGNENCPLTSTTCSSASPEDSGTPCVSFTLTSPSTSPSRTRERRSRSETSWARRG